MGADHERQRHCHKCGDISSHDIYDMCPRDLDLDTWDPCDYDMCTRQKKPGESYCTWHDDVGRSEPFDWLKFLIFAVIFGGIGIAYLVTLAR